jgi:hypothetical protein
MSHVEPLLELDEELLDEELLELDDELLELDEELALDEELLDEELALDDDEEADELELCPDDELCPEDDALDVLEAVPLELEVVAPELPPFPELWKNDPGSRLPDVGRVQAPSAVSAPPAVTSMTLAIEKEAMSQS